MKGRVMLLCLSLITVHNFLSSSLYATDAAVSPEERKPRPCCPVGIAYNAAGGSVILEQICSENNTVVFHMKTKNMAQACTHPPSTILRDQTGKRYQMVSHRGLPDCESGERSSQPNLSFQWTFEKLSASARTLALVEVEDTVTEGLSFWAWRNVDISRCRF